ncbi:RNA polymerase sigma factor [Nonomuraea rhodomycinica]|uniref:RNA polymerase sigma factor n=1 Tax=Nonomuraea rhodomycinica TaxID=1712872 RepID=UPI001C37686A
MNVEDGRIIERSLSEPEAFAEIFDRHFRTIHRYLARRLGTDAADDLAGEVFTLAFARRTTYRIDQPVALPWLYGIAGNLIHAHQRARRRDATLIGSLPPESTPPPSRTRWSPPSTRAAGCVGSGRRSATCPRRTRRRCSSTHGRT